MSSCDDTKGPKASFKTAGDTVSYELGMAWASSKEDIKMNLSNPMMGSDSAYVDDYLKGIRDGILAAEDKKKAAYVAGLQTGFRMGQNLAQGEKELFADSTETLSRKNFLSGYMAGVDGKHTALKVDGKMIDQTAAQQDLQTRIPAMISAAAEKKYAENKKKGDDFMAAKAKEAGIQKLPGGTLYKVITAGTGEKVTDGAVVNVTYEGRLVDGTVFDASNRHSDQPIQMQIGSAVPGFDAALKAMPIGSEWEIYLPADQAYGSQGNQQIPPYSVLIFKVKLVGIYTAPEANQE